MPTDVSENMSKTNRAVTTEVQAETDYIDLKQYGHTLQVATHIECTSRVEIRSALK